MMPQAPAGWTPVKPPAGWSPAPAPDTPVPVPASWATLNDQPIEMPTTVGESFSAFGGGVKEMVDPRPLLTALYERGPVEILKGMGMAQQEQYEKGRQAMREGRWSEALGYTAAWLMPLVGPAAATAGETIGRGEIARGTGQMVGLLAPFGAKAMAGRVGEGMAAVGEGMAKAGENKYAKAYTPVTGANKLDFAEMAKKSAPTLVREPGMGALSLDSLSGKFADSHASALRDLHGAYAQIPPGKIYQTGPIMARLNDALKRLRYRGSSATGPSGALRENTPVDPAQHLARIQALEAAKRELLNAGEWMDIDNLRTMITAWQKGGEGVYTPSTVKNYLADRGTGAGWADAGSAAREYLVTKEPQTAAANARFSLMENARKAVEAAQETEFVRPSRGKGMVATTVGGMMGLGAGGGAFDVAVGSMIGLLLTKAEMSATGQIALARALARVGDAFKAGKPHLGMQILQQQAESMGVVIPAAARAQGGPVAVPVAERQEPTGTPTIGPPRNRR